MSKPESIMIDGVKYVRDAIGGKAQELGGMPYVICRTYTAGVFAGYLQSRSGQEVVIQNARRLWHWSGAASLSQMAESGTSTPHTCKFPQEVSRVELMQVIEILTCTEAARTSIASVPVWKL